MMSHLVAYLLVAALGLLHGAAAEEQVASADIGVRLVVVHSQRTRQPDGCLVELPSIAGDQAKAQVAYPLSAQLQKREQELTFQEGSMTLEQLHVDIAGGATRTHVFQQAG